MEIFQNIPEMGESKTSAGERRLDQYLQVVAAARVPLQVVTMAKKLATCPSIFSYFLYLLYSNIWGLAGPGGTAPPKVSQFLDIEKTY